MYKFSDEGFLALPVVAGESWDPSSSVTPHPSWYCVESLRSYEAAVTFRENTKRPESSRWLELQPTDISSDSGTEPHSLPACTSPLTELWSRTNQREETGGWEGGNANAKCSTGQVSISL